MRKRENLSSGTDNRRESSGLVTGQNSHNRQHATETSNSGAVRCLGATMARHKAPPAAVVWSQSAPII